MIRHDSTLNDGSPAWVLISQVDHAHLAGELAESWRDGLPTIGVLLPTIFRHDDGWRTWERSPTIDPDDQRPRSFLEMPSTEAHEIWRASIDGVADLGPLAQYVVAEHFCRLRRAGEASHDAKVLAFLREYAEHCQRWLSRWQAEDPSRNTLAVAERAVDWLQFFDQLSLWLCMAQRLQPHEFALPGGEKMTLTPKPPAADWQRVCVEPWPWNAGERELRVGGRRIRQQPLTSDAELRQLLVSAEMVEFRWKMTPGNKS